MASPDLQDIAHAIQLAIAPVFLLTGIAGLLSVMTNRLARIIDRGRWFDQQAQQTDAAFIEKHRREWSTLERRRKLASRAINACTAAALLVCGVIMALFAEALLSFSLRGLAAGLFITTMGLLITGLVNFLREVTLAADALQVSGLEPLKAEPKPSAPSDPAA